MSKQFYYPVDKEGMDREIESMGNEIEQWERQLETFGKVVFFVNILFLISLSVWLYLQLRK